MKIGISVKLDVTKIDKSRLFKGEKGTYLDLTTFIDLSELDQYGNNGFISQSVNKEERETGKRGDILGNVKVFYNDSADAPHQNHQNTPQPQQQSAQQQKTQNVIDQDNDFNDDIPF